MLVSPGRIVSYCLSAADADEINRRRISRDEIRRRLSGNPPTWPAGAQAHVGDRVCHGDHFPAIVVSAVTTDVLSQLIDAQVFLRGNDVLYVSGRPPGRKGGEWSWPDRQIGG